MLKTPSNLQKTEHNPILMIISGMDPSTPTESSDKVLAPGYNLIRHHSGDMLLWGGNSPPDRSKHDYAWPHLGDDLNCYGVCDSIEQFQAKFHERLEKDERTFCVFFTHIAKDKDNAGQGGGWRWHKWGPYVGEGKPECEYLDDEDGFENGVYTYHVYQIDGPVLKSDFEKRLDQYKEIEKTQGTEAAQKFMRGES